MLLFHCAVCCVNLSIRTKRSRVCAFPCAFTSCVCVRACVCVSVCSRVRVLCVRATGSFRSIKLNEQAATRFVTNERRVLCFTELSFPPSTASSPLLPCWNTATSAAAAAADDEEIVGAVASASTDYEYLLLSTSSSPSPTTPSPPSRNCNHRRRHHHHQNIKITARSFHLLLSCPSVVAVVARYFSVTFFLILE